MKRPYFRRPLTLSTAEIVFSSRIFCSLLQYCVLLTSELALCLLRDLDPYGGKDHDGKFPLFYKQVARELAHKLAVIFKNLVEES